MRLIWLSTRHYLFHLVIGLILYEAISRFYINLSFFPWIVGTFLIDVDHLISLINPNDPTSRKFFNTLNSPENHKKKLLSIIKLLEGEGFTRLIFHNFIALVVVIVMIFFFNRNSIILSILGGVLVHQSFDIICDIIRWRNINHWLWR